MCLPVGLPVGLCIYLSLCLSICLSVHLCVCVCECLSAYLSICLFASVSVFDSLSVRLRVCVSVCLSLVVRFPGLFRICEPLFLFSVSLHCSYSISHNICIVYMLLMKDWVVFLLCPNVVGHQDIHIIWAMSIILT